MAISIDDIPKDLIDDYLDKKCGFFVGAGLSRGAGLPDWKGLLLKMIDKAVADLQLNEARAADCRNLANDPNKYLMLAGELRDVLDADFKTVLEDTFTNEEIKPTETHNILVKLKYNNFIITTNYDQLIEQAFVNNKILNSPYKYYEANAIQRQLYRRKYFLLKAHGDALTAADKIILTESDYRNLMFKEPGYRSILQSIFTMYSVIFIGCSLDDPELRLLLNYINNAFPDGGIPQFALMSTDATGETERSRWRKDYNMRIIPISPANDYEDISIFLNLLREKEDERDRQGAEASEV